MYWQTWKTAEARSYRVSFVAGMTSRMPLAGALCADSVEPTSTNVTMALSCEICNRSSQAPQRARNKNYIWPHIKVQFICTHAIHSTIHTMFGFFIVQLQPLHYRPNTLKMREKKKQFNESASCLVRHQSIKCLCEQFLAWFYQREIFFFIFYSLAQFTCSATKSNAIRADEELDDGKWMVSVNGDARSSYGWSTYATMLNAQLK